MRNAAGIQVTCSDRWPLTSTIGHERRARLCVSLCPPPPPGRSLLLHGETARPTSSTPLACGSAGPHRGVWGLLLSRLRTGQSAEEHCSSLLQEEE